ncbi:MAG: hypothetical protein QOE13_110 [Gaiellaceae bacterium]|jgi:hypothetical protein|nr:hypothetical protein [Gaiellaceae bacterium]
MMSLLFPACFLALATVSGLAAAAGRRWALRLPLLAATPVLALAVWWQLSVRDGWPTSSHPADGSSFVAGVVQAPTPQNAGVVYLWAQPPNSDTPKAYRLPYSRQLERQVAQAASAAKRGTRVGLRATRNRKRTRRAGSPQQPSGPLEFYRLPPPKLAAKNHST